MGDFQPDQAGFRALALGPEIRAALEAEALKGKAFAVAESQSFARTHEYADSFEVTHVTVLRRLGPRAGVQLENTSGHAAAVEFGNEHVARPHRVLGKTLAYLESSP